MAAPSSDDVEKLVFVDRYSSLGALIPLILYLPIGLALGLLRSFIFLHACLIFYVLPNCFPFKRLILRVMLSVTGLPILTQGILHSNNKKKVVISNSVTNLDPFVLALVCPNILATESTGSPHFQQKPTKTYSCPSDSSHDNVLAALKEKIGDAEEPLLFFPERVKTNGEHSLLKFSLLPFEVDHPIQPVTIQTKRYLFDLHVSTHSSSALEDLLWCFLLPFTVYKVRYLPVTERKKDESSEDFANRVQSNMAKSLGVTASKLTHYDVAEYIKRKEHARKDHSAQVKPKQQLDQVAPSSKQAPWAERQSPFVAETAELEQMVQQVRDVLPDTQHHVVLADLRKTKDVDLTITNILEGKVDLHPSSRTASAALEPSSVSLNSLSGGLSFKSRFEKTAASRQLSFAERKQAMLEAARLKYRIKHGL